MTLVDTSVWVDFLRQPAETVPVELRDLLHAQSAAICEPIEMELLFGPGNEVALRRVERLIGSLDMLGIRPDLDFRDAAAIFRAVRRSGRTVRSKVDCLIAAVAIRHDVPLLHRDADFEVIGAVTDLRQHSLRPGAD